MHHPDNDDEDSTGHIASLSTQNGIIGYHLMPTCQKDQEPPQKQAKEIIAIRSNLESTSFIENFATSWGNDTTFTTEQVELITEPFKVSVVQNLLQNVTFLEKVLEEFNELEWNRRSLDLYEFYQSLDLKHITSKYISEVYKFLRGDVKSWVEKLTGLELTSISATCSFYSDTDYLLVHDDQQEDRVVAFVLYLMGPRNWSEENGGALQLLDKDHAGQPCKVVRDILPCNNQFVFFKVSNDSYHQVAEVMNKNDCRMSINGWFHHKPLVFEAPLFKTPTTGLFGSNVLTPDKYAINLKEWVNPAFFDLKTIENLHQHIEEHSEMCLCGFFHQEVLECLLPQLQSNSIEWKQLGPPNRYSYEVPVEESLPEFVRQFLKVFSSTELFDLLQMYTELELKSVRYELQRWKPGCYSLLSDHEWSNELDLVMFFGCPDSKSVAGGRIMYIAADEEIEDALVTIEPDEPTLNVVFRDTARITKYVSKYSDCSLYYLLICSYSE